MLDPISCLDFAAKHPADTVNVPVLMVFGTECQTQLLNAAALLDCVPYLSLALLLVVGAGHHARMPDAARAVALTTAIAAQPGRMARWQQSCGMADVETPLRDAARVLLWLILFV